MEYFKEREAEINGSLLAVLSGENLLFLGPPGTAKTQLAKNICQLIEGGNFFNFLLTSFSTPEEIFGPLSLKALEEDEFRRKSMAAFQLPILLYWTRFLKPAVPS